jgi:MoaA/NifB/PqqE/SkfB family radical SAM enzyme
MKLGLDRAEILEVELELTGTCNLDCPLCLRSYENAQHLVQKNIRPVDEWITQLDTFPNLKFVCMAGSVSEPTMYKDFVPLVKYLVGRGIKIELYTNGNTHKPEWWKALGDIFAATDRVYFTICGSTQELHEVYRVNSSLQQIRDHATAFRQSGKCNDWCQHIRFEYNAKDLESDAMKAIIAEFSNPWLIDSSPYQERFGIIKEDTAIKMHGKLGEKYNTIKNSILKRHANGASCKMRCKSYETKFLSINQFGEEFPCFLYRVYKKTPFDHNDYSEIHKFEFDFCYECESMTTSILERNGMERMV